MSWRRLEKNARTRRFRGDHRPEPRTSRRFPPIGVGFIAMAAVLAILFIVVAVLLVVTLL